MSKVKIYTRNEWGRCKTTLETSGEDVFRFVITFSFGLLLGLGAVLLALKKYGVVG